VGCQVSPVSETRFCSELVGIFGGPWRVRPLCACGPRCWIPLIATAAVVDLIASQPSVQAAVSGRLRETGPMQPEEIHGIAAALGRDVVGTSTLAGGFSHETCLLTLTDVQVVARLGGSDPAVEAAVMAAVGRYVPVPQVLLVMPSAAEDEGARPAMVLEYVAGTPLSQVLAMGSAGRPWGISALRWGVSSRGSVR
jgi:hypothetical protein